MSDAPVLADLDARLAAQTVFDRPFALEAGAGTGKTAALVARIAAWCLGPGWERAAASSADEDEIAAAVLEGVVAITFTEAAAAEMAARVAVALSEIQRSGPMAAGPREPVFTGLYRGSLPEREDVVRRRAAHLLAQLERLRVSTIHAFARSILARFPVEAGVRPGFEVDADGSLVREILESAAEELLLPGYEAGDETLLALAESGIGPADITEAALSLAAAGLPADQLQEDPFTQDAVAPLLDELHELIGPCGHDADAYAAKTGNIGAGGRLLRQLLDLLADRRRIAALELARSLAGVVGSPDSAAGLKKLREWSHPEKLNRPKPEHLGPEEFSRRIAEALPILPFFEHFDPETFGRLRAVLARILGRVETEKLRRGVLAFHDLLRLTRRLLEADAGVRRQLRGEIQQLLVDEMQDTDPEQAKIVELLSVTGEEPRPCLFLVGDPKQSIYAFRDADFAAYQRLVAAIRRAGGEVRSLTVNFRSAAPILDEVERIVAPVMVEEDGVQAPFEPLLPGPGLADDPGCTEGGRRPVEHWISVPPDPDRGGLAEKARADEVARFEAEAVARDIRDLHDAHGVDYGEMAVLMRTSTHADRLLEALRAHGIPYEVGKDRTYFRTREVAEIMALVRLILDRHDPQALLTVLRSPFAGVPDAALVPLWRERLPALAAGVDGPDLAPELRTAVEQVASSVASEVVPRLPDPGLGSLGEWPGALLAFLEHLGVLRRAFADRAPDRFVEELRRRTLVEPLAAARFPGEYRLANVERFLLQLEEKLGRATGPGEILAWLRRAGRELPDQETARPRRDAGGVRVLTIHGAKGLGFEQVWLYQAGHGRHGRNTGPGTGARRHPGTGRWEISLFGTMTPGWPAAEKAAAAVAEAERVRLLYVALTRAKRRLVTIGAPQLVKGRKKDEGPLWTAQAGSPLELMARRTGAWRLDAGALLEAADRRGLLEDDDGVLWRLLARAESAPRPQRGCERKDDTAGRLARLAADRERLDALREEAQARQARRWIAPVTAEAHRELADAVAASVAGAETPEEEAARRREPVSRDVATAVGSAAHRILERFDLAAGDPAAELEARRREADEWLAAAVPTDRLAAARARLGELVATFRSGPLWDRWLAVRGHVIARELPLLAPPGRDPEGPVAALIGAVDLLYRDPGSGELVVADYKTDDPAHVDERAGAYEIQVARYAEAVRAALGLPVTPGTELWFLAAGLVRRTG